MFGTPGRPLVIGHRGAAKWAPENTLASFFCAADLGVSWVEFDVRLCKGGIPVVFHDATLDRTTNGMGPLLDHRLDELKSLDAGRWFAPRFRDEPIPTLDEALSTLSGLGLAANIEIKTDPGTEAETAKAALASARRLWPDHLPPPLFSSFSETALTALRAFDGGAKIGYLAQDFSKAGLGRARALGAVSFHLAEAHVSQAIGREIHEAGMAFLAYTVNGLERARELAGMGVDGLFTDDPKTVCFS